MPIAASIGHFAPKTSHLRAGVCTTSPSSRRFGIDELSPRSDRHAGHLFIFIDQRGVLTDPDRVRFTGVTPRPAETVFVLAKSDATSWQCIGVARSPTSSEPGSLRAIGVANDERPSAGVLEAFQ